MSWGYYPEYVPVAQRQANARRQMAKLRKKGQTITPIEPFKGQKIARTFWGQAWCRHIECLADFESRLAKGKTYVRNGSVCHLAISKGRVEAYVCGSELYKIQIDIDPLPKKQWTQLKRQCASQIGSAVELLQGTFSDSVMTILTDPDTGMFPHANDFRLDCNCPDWVHLCKHLAAVLYGVGVRLDTEPELLFTLRGVDYGELIDAAGMTVEPVDASADAAFTDDDLADVLGIDLAIPSDPPAAAKPPAKSRPKTKSTTQTAKTVKKSVKNRPKTPAKAKKPATPSRKLSGSTRKGTRK